MHGALRSPSRTLPMKCPNPMKITYYAAASLDGYIAKVDGDVSWLEEQPIDETETGLAEFMQRVDGLVMGRKTYDFVYDYGSWPYGDKWSWVCTSRPMEKLDGANLRTTPSIEEVVHQAQDLQLQHLWLVGGGQLASAFLDRGLITDISITEIPIELEAGIRLFSNHQLADILPESHRITQRTGFRQIDVTIKP